VDRGLWTAPSLVGEILGKTFEALNRTDKESGKESLFPPEFTESETNTPSFETAEDDFRQEISPPRAENLNLPFSPSPGEEYPHLRTPLAPRKLTKFKKTSLTVEEYRKMQHKIFNNKLDKPIKSILFCSSHRGEGNSTVCLNFAQTLAGQGYRVLLVDADLRNPTLHHMFQFDQGRGLTDLCLGNTDLQKGMKNTMLDNLWVITSGIPYSNPSAIFGSEAFDALLDQMKVQADCILFDSPPLDSYDDSIALAAKVDGVVLVVQSEKTRREVAHKSKDRLGTTGAHILGVVLNRRRFHIPGWLYKRL
jgi:capsular exopolysaccharide synthesis family protein